MGAWTVSAASLACRGVIPSKRTTSSRSLGWTSLLVDVHAGIAWNQTYHANVTLDPRVGVSLRGQYLSHYYARGTWRPDVFSPGTTTVLRSEEQRRFRFSPLQGSECEFALIYVPLGQLEEMAEHVRRPGQRARAPWFNQLLAQDPETPRVARALIAAMRGGADELYASTVSAWLATHVLVRRHDEDRASGELSDRRLRRVLDLVAVHFAERLTLERLAAEAGISKFHFARLFREQMGVTPYRYVMETRLAAARTILETTDLEVAAVALRCGYLTVAHFSSAFSARFGRSPSAARRR